MSCKNLILYLTVILLLLAYQRLWSNLFPKTIYFPIRVGYSFSMSSANGKRIRFEEKIELPENPGGGVWVLWKCFFEFPENENREYILKLWVNENGEGYLLSLKDGPFERSFSDTPMIFPNTINFNVPFQLGENISFTYIKSYKTFVHPVLKKSFSSIIVSKLKMGKNDILLYFKENYGLILIETKNEIFSLD